MATAQHLKPWQQMKDIRRPLVDGCSLTYKVQVWYFWRVRKQKQNHLNSKKARGRNVVDNICISHSLLTQKEIIANKINWKHY